MGGVALKTGGAAFAALFLSLAATVKAHEHHMDHIEEGSFISDDPIVCQRGNASVGSIDEC